MNSSQTGVVRPLTLSQVLLCGAAIVTLSMGIRHGFGLWMAPMTMDRGWTRESFSFAMAVQNLAWGVAGPVAGVLADRFGAWRVLIIGALVYSLGLALMAVSPTGMAFAASAGLLVGAAQAGHGLKRAWACANRFALPPGRVPPG